MRFAGQINQFFVFVIVIVQAGGDSQPFNILLILTLNHYWNQIESSFFFILNATKYPGFAFSKILKIPAINKTKLRLNSSGTHK